MDSPFDRENTTLTDLDPYRAFDTADSSGLLIIVVRLISRAAKQGELPKLRNSNRML